VRERQETFVSGGVAVRVEHFEPAAEGKYPAALFLPGCDGLEKAAPRYRAAARLLAGSGYVVLLVRYLDRTGVAEVDPATLAGSPDFPAWLEAARDGLTYACQLPNVAEGRVGLAGVSLGGFLAVTLASQDRRVGAVVELFGGLHPDYFDRLTTMPPTLVLHGEADAVVSVEEARKLERLLKDRGQPYEITIYPGQGHGFDPAATLDAAERAKAFLARHLKGCSPP
jgi:carboxymethylenebutenolidase